MAIASLALPLGLSACGSTDEVVAGADGEDQEQSQDQPTGDTDDAMDDDDEGAMSGDYELTEPRPEMISAQTAEIHSVEAIDETTLAVRYQNGSEPCSAANVTITESDTSVTVLLETGLDPNAAAMSCIAQVIDYEIQASLSEALGDRELIVEGP